MKTKIIGVFVILALVIVAAGAFILLRGDEDTWLCQNGVWVKHGQPSSPAPTTGCGQQTGLANPASLFCQNNGGRLTLATDASGGQNGQCYFSDGSACEEWAYFRGECRSGQNITVFEPLPGASLSAGLLTVKGIARVFEAVVSYRLKDQAGNILTSGTTMAQSPDMGQFGPFEIKIDTAKSAFSGQAILEVYQASAKDGSDTDLVVVPLTLPARLD